MAGPVGERLHLYARNGRLDVSGCFPRTAMRVKHCSISVGAARPPAVIAAEVARRLLPGYRAALAEVAEYEAAVSAAQLQRDVLAARITGLFPDGAATLPSHCQSAGRTEIVLHLGGAGGWVKFCGAGLEVEFDRLRVPADAAVDMLAVLARAGGCAR